MTPSARRGGTGQHRKISEQQVAEVARRHAAGETKRSLARAFGVSASVLGERLKRWQAAQEEAMATRERWLEQLRAASAELEVLNRPPWSPHALAGAPGWSLAIQVSGDTEESRDDGDDTEVTAPVPTAETSEHVTQDGDTSAIAAPWSVFGIGAFPHASRSEGCTSNAMDGAASHGHLDVLQWLRANRSEGCSVFAMETAAKKGFFHVALFLHAHRSEGVGVNCIRELSDFIADMELMQWLRKEYPSSVHVPSLSESAAFMPAVLAYLSELEL